MMYLPNPIAGARSAASEMRVDDILDRDPAEQILVRLGVIVGVSSARLGIVVLLGKEARGSQDNRRQSFIAMEELAEVFGRPLGDAVDVLRDGRDPFVDPGRRRARRGLQRVAEGARGRGHDEGADARAHRCLEQNQRSGDIGLDEGSARMRRDMGLVQRRGVEDRVGAVDAARDASAVGDRPDLVGERPGNDVEPQRRAARRAQHAHQRFAEMA